MMCFNYGCLTQEAVVYSDKQLHIIKTRLAQSQSAAEERTNLAYVLGLLLGWAGEQTPISADRGGNLADNAVYGRMDCIDHSTTSTRLLQLLKGRGWLRYHRVLEPALRTRFLIFLHYSAQIAETAEPHHAFAVDTWFYDNGQPAVIMPIERWLSGESPDDVE